MASLWRPTSATGSVFARTDVTSEADIAATVGLGDLRIAVNRACIGTSGRVLGKNDVLPLAVFDRIIQVKAE